MTRCLMRASQTDQVRFRTPCFPSDTPDSVMASLAPVEVARISALPAVSPFAYPSLANASLTSGKSETVAQPAIRALAAIIMERLSLPWRLCLRAMRAETGAKSTGPRCFYRKSGCILIR